MKRSRTILIMVALLAVATGAGWYWGSPWWTLRSMKQAAEARDIAALSTHIDYPSLRAGMKRELRARVRPDDGVLGALVSRGITDTVVEVALRPEGMRAIFAAAPLAAPEAGGVKMNANDMILRRDSVAQFRLVRRQDGGGALIFRLRGVRWMLSDVELPPEALR